MNEIVINIIGFLAGACTAIAMVPQVIKSLRTKKVEDLSFLMLIIYLAGAFLWTIYGILIKSLPVIIADMFAFCLIFSQLLIKIKYTKG